MGDKIAGLVGREASVMSLLKWILGEFKEITDVRQFDLTASLEKALEIEVIDVLILDAEVMFESVLKL
jgi:hypothetical protein